MACTNLRQAVFEKHASGCAPVGPGEYSLAKEVALTRPRSPTVRLGTAPRMHDLADETPGPGTYVVPRDMRSFDSRLVNAPVARIGTSPRDPGIRDPTPAPGQYVLGSPSLIATKAPAFSLPKSPRALHNVSEVPGPGAYGAPEVGLGRTAVGTHANAPVPVFGTAPRSKDATDYIPGPGDYSLFNVDAVGTRPVSSQRPGTATARIGSSPRFAGGANDTPGPLDYVPRIDFVAGYASAPRVRIGSSPREASDVREKAAIPGPGAYSIAAVDSLGGKKVPSNRPSSPRTKFGTAPRMPVPDSSTPAPGQYNLLRDPTLPSSPRPVMPTAPRMPTPGDAIPGPSDYVPSIKAVRPGTASARFGGSKRFSDNSSAREVPGPAAYAGADRTRILARAPATRFGSSPRGDPVYEALAASLPGPGNYHTGQATDKVRPRSAVPRIGSAPRFHDVRDSSPGPADYRNDGATVRRKAPAFTMRAR